MISQSMKIQPPGIVSTDRVTWFIRQANNYRSNIKLTFGDQCINAKSLLGVMSLGLQGGQEIKITADGIDESEAVRVLCKYWEAAQ